MSGKHFWGGKLKSWAIYWLLLGLVSTGSGWAKVAPGARGLAAEKPALPGVPRTGARLAAALPKSAQGAALPALASPVFSKAKAQNGGAVLVVVRGNSQANGDHTTGGASTIGSQTNGAWPDEAAALLGSGYVWQNRSKDGATIDYLRQSDDAEVAPLFHTGNYGEEWIVLQETTNQIFQANPAQQVYSKMVAWAQYWRAQGVKVAVVTCYPTQEAQYDPEIDAINALYRANWSSFCDMLLDAKSSPYLTQLGMDPQYGYSPDGLHLTDTGNLIPAHCAADGFSGARTGIIPATFVLPGITVPGGVTTPTTPTAPTAPTNPTTPVPAGTSLRLQYGTGAGDYVTNGQGGIVQRLDQSGQGRVATVTPGQDGPLLSSDNGRQVALFDPGRKGWTQSLTTAGALAANADASLVVDLRRLGSGANSVLSVGPDFSIWFQGSTKLQVFDRGGNYVTPVDFDQQGLTRCIFTFEAATQQMVVYVADAEVYRATLAALPWVGTAPVLDLEQGSYLGGQNALSGEIGALAVYSGLLSAAERTAWFNNAAATSSATLTAFTATASAGSTAVALAWSAAPQKSKAQFQIERSTDGIAFSRVGATTSTSAAANSFGLTDSQLPTAAPTLYYRVRTTDASGVASYSAVRTVELAPAAASLALYPNPARTATRLQNAAPNAKVQLLNSMGQVVATVTTDATGAAELLLPTGLASGVYLVRQGARFSRLVVE